MRWVHVGAGGRAVEDVVDVVGTCRRRRTCCGVEDVDAVDAVVGADRDVERHQLVEVRRRGGVGLGLELRELEGLRG